MKILRLSTISVCLLVSVTLFSQDAITASDTRLTTSFYDFEIIPTGRMLDGDTLYQVVLEMDSTDVKKYESIFIENPYKTRELSLSAKELLSNSQIERSNGKYRLNMMEWSHLNEAHVIATKPDGTKIVLRPRPDPNAVVHKIKRQYPITRDLKIFDGEEIDEEEIQQQQVPVNPRKDS